jgi:hypothetical protein
MKTLTSIFVLFLLLLMSVLLEGFFSYADAAVLCTNPSGSVSARTTQCIGNETQLNPAAFGLVGPTGPQGPAGPPGPTGAQGPAGPQGVYTTRPCNPTLPCTCESGRFSSAVGQNAPC